MPGYGKYRSPEEKEEFVKQLGADAKQRVIDLAENWEADAKDVAEFLIFSSRFPDYSVRNQMLIYKQNPYAMFTAGYNQFEKMGYKDRLTYAVEAVRVLATVENPVEQDLFAAQIAAEVGVGRESILAQVQAAATDPANKTVPEEIKDEEIFEPEEEPTQRYHAFIRPVSDAESEVVAFADVIINEDYRINGVRLVLDEHNRFSALMPAYLAKDRREWVPYVELKPEIEREMTAFLARNFDFNSEVEVIGGGTAIDVGETKLTLRKAANRNTVKAYAELQNDVFALKYGKIMEGKRGYFYSPPSMGTYTDQDGNKQYQYAYGFASAPERTRISGEIKKQYELMCKKNKRVYEAKIK